MASIKKNISQEGVQLKKPAKVVILQSEYNADITDALAKSCLEELRRAGALDQDLLHFKVPGAWELPIACQRMAETENPAAIITLGLILRGDTPHFDFIASACAKGIMEASLKVGIPIIFGVLTTDTLFQAQARIHGGSHGDKGIEAAQAAIKMINLL